VAKVSIVRLDDRMIHGQVVSRWVHEAKCNRIMVIDDVVSKDPFQQTILRLAAPSEMQVETLGAAEAGQKWQENQLGEGTILAIFKTVEQLNIAIENGFETSEVQVGGLGKKEGVKSKLVYKTVSMTQEAAGQLLALQEKGIKVYFQQTPDTGSASLDSVLKKHYPELLKK